MNDIPVVAFNRLYPACFNNKQEHIDWLRFKHMSGNSVKETICTDCNGDYMTQMCREHRCHPDEARHWSSVHKHITIDPYHRVTR